MARGQPTTAEERAAGPAAVAAAVLPYPLALATLGLTYWTVDMVAPALPAVREALALSGTTAGLVFAAFFGGRLIANLPAALLVDRAGPRRTAALGALVVLAGSLLAATAASGAALLPARGLQGVGVALLVTAGLLSVLQARPGRGAAMTAFNLAAGLGGSAGLLSGGGLTEAVGWRAVFWLSAALGAALLAGALLWPRATLSTGSASPPRADDAPAMAVGPSSALAGALLANLLVFGLYSVWVVALPLYAAERFGADAGRIGRLLLVVNVIHLGAALPAGRAIRRLGPTRPLVAGFGITATGLAVVLVAPSEGWLMLPMACYAVGQGTASSAAGDLLLRHGGGGGRAVGMVRLTSDVGLVVGPAGVGALADAAGVGAPFVALAALAAVAAGGAWWGSRGHRTRLGGGGHRG